MIKIKFKQHSICGHKLHYSYLIFANSENIGKISFRKYHSYFVIGFFSIYETYRNQHYGYKVIEYILSHYKIKCIIGQTLYESRSFWNKCIKEFNGFRKNIVSLDNCSSSFVIPKYNIEINTFYQLLDLGHEIE